MFTVQVALDPDRVANTLACSMKVPATTYPAISTVVALAPHVITVFEGSEDSTLMVILNASLPSGG